MSEVAMTDEAAHSLHWMGTSFQNTHELAQRSIQRTDLRKANAALFETRKPDEGLQMKDQLAVVSRADLARALVKSAKRVQRLETKIAGLRRGLKALERELKAQQARPWPTVIK